MAELEEEDEREEEEEEDAYRPVVVIRRMAEAWQLMAALVAAMAIVWVWSVGFGVFRRSSSKNLRW